MELSVNKIDGTSVAALSVSNDIFGLEPRLDIISRVVRWQEANTRTGSSNTQNRSNVRGTTKKPFAQKGTGNARQGSLKGPHQRGGGVAHGPLTRLVGQKLPKKLRKLGVRHALSLKVKEQSLFILESFDIKTPSVKTGIKLLSDNKIEKVLFIGGREESENLRLSVNNIHGVNFLPDVAVNAKSLLSYDTVVIAQNSINKIEEALTW